MIPGVNVIKLFSFVAVTRPNKLECLYLAITFQSSLTFADNTRSLPKEDIWKALQMGWLWPYPQILRPDWKGFLRTNPLAYKALSSVTKEESFKILTPGGGRIGFEQYTPSPSLEPQRCTEKQNLTNCYFLCSNEALSPSK